MPKELQNPQSANKEFDVNTTGEQKNASKEGEVKQWKPESPTNASLDPVNLDTPVADNQVRQWVRQWDPRDLPPLSPTVKELANEIEGKGDQDTHEAASRKLALRNTHGNRDHTNNKTSVEPEEKSEIKEEIPTEGAASTEATKPIISLQSLRTYSRETQPQKEYRHDFLFKGVEGDELIFNPIGLDQEKQLFYGLCENKPSCLSFESIRSRFSNTEKIFARDEYDGNPFLIEGGYSDKQEKQLSKALIIEYKMKARLFQAPESLFKFNKEGKFITDDNGTREINDEEWLKIFNSSFKGKPRLNIITQEELDTIRKGFRIKLTKSQEGVDIITTRLRLNLTNSQDIENLMAAIDKTASKNNKESSKEIEKLAKCAYILEHCDKESEIFKFATKVAGGYDRNGEKIPGVSSVILVGEGGIPLKKGKPFQLDSEESTQVFRGNNDTKVDPEKTTFYGFFSRQSSCLPFQSFRSTKNKEVLVSDKQEEIPGASDVGLVGVKKKFDFGGDQSALVALKKGGVSQI